MMGIIIIVFVTKKKRCKVCDIKEKYHNFEGNLKETETIKGI